MLIINAVAVHFYARFLKKKKKKTIFSHIQEQWAQTPKSMPTHHFVYMSDIAS